MANTKISNLPAAASLTGSDLMPVVQSGVTKKGTFDQIPFLQAGAGAVARTAQAKMRDTVSVKDFGAVGDSNISTGGGADDTSAITAAIAHCVSTGATLFAPSGSCFRITSAIDMRGVKGIDWQGQIFCDSITSGPAVTIGGMSAGTGVNVFFNQIHDGGSYTTAPTHALLRVFGLKSSIVDVVICKYIELYADEAVTNCTSNAYNTFTLGYCYKLQLKGNGSNSWNNENVFNGGRLRVLNIGTTTTEYIHNHNIWTFPTFEGAIEINVQAGALNRILNARFEGVDVAGTQVTFSSVSYENFIVSQYDTVPTGSDFAYAPIPLNRVSDSGQNNVIFKDVLQYYDKVPLFTLDARTPLVVDGTVGSSTSYATTNQRGLFDRSIPAVYGYGFSVPGLDYIKFTSSFRDVYTSDFIPASVGDPYFAQFETTASIVRMAVRVYDANFALLGAEGAGGAYIASGSFTYNGAGQYAASGNLTSTNSSPLGAFGFSVRRSEVKYIRVSFLIGSGSGGDLRSAAIYFLDKPGGQTKQQVSAVKDFRTMTLPSIPTAGYVRRGTMVSKEDGTSIYICTFSFETTLNGALSAGATSVTVTSATGVANSDIVGILLDDGTTHWSTVSGLAGSTFTVAALPSAAANGQRVAFNRWATK